MLTLLPSNCLQTIVCNIRGIEINYDKKIIATSLMVVSSASFATESIEDAYLKGVVSGYCGRGKDKPPSYMDTKYNAFRDAIKESCEEEPDHSICKNNILGSLDELCNSCKVEIVGEADASLS